MKLLLRIAAALLLAGFILPGGETAVLLQAAAKAPRPAKLTADLAARLKTAAEGENLPVTVILDPGPGARAPAVEAPGWRETIERLKAVASSSQRPLLEDLAARFLPAAARRPRSLWLVNALSLEATPEVIRWLAGRPEVVRVEADPLRPVFAFEEIHNGVEIPHFGDPIDWGVEEMGAPRAWNELGLTGEGVIVAVLDSGVCYEHPDIRRHLWVNPGEDLDGNGEVMDEADLNGIDDDGNGFVDDLIGWDFDEQDNDPWDETSGHGSHVAGTVAGDGTSGHRSGGAPGTTVMAVRVGTRSSREASVWAGLEYAAENGAQVISMSLGWSHAWNPDRATWREIAERLEGMGILLVAAAGNEGDLHPPDNVRTPADVPGVIAVGATGPGGGAADFSSRGPVGWQSVEPYFDHPFPPGLLKPDVSAPGVDTRSHNFCRGYDDRSGTSMATPHVSAAAALVLEADPFLEPAETAEILREAAVDLGPAGPDPVFGAGRVDAFAAAKQALRPLLYDAERIDDREGGNGDLAVDPGETVDLWLRVRNRSDALTLPARAGLKSETPGVEVIEASADLPALAPGEGREILEPFRVRFSAPCGAHASFVLSVEQPGRRASRSRFQVLVGSEEEAVLFADGMEQERGWSVTSTAAGGDWVRGIPRGTLHLGQPANPGEDAGPGSWAYVTGNEGITAADDDVDGGETVLLSPVLDAARFSSMNLSYQRWFYHPGMPTLPPRGYFIAEFSRDGGQRWSLIEARVAGQTPWISARFPLWESGGEGAGSSDLRLRFRVGEQAPPGDDEIVEAGLDEVRLSGRRIVCD